jgi:hypothetical protein
MFIKNKTRLNVSMVSIALMVLLVVSFVFENNVMKSPIVQTEEYQSTTLGPKQKEERRKEIVATKRVKKWKRLNKSSILDNPKTSGATGFYFVIVRLWEVGELDKLLGTYCDNDRGNYLCDPKNPYEVKVHLPSVHTRNNRNPDYGLYASDNRAFVIGLLSKPRFYYACMKALFKRSPILLQQTVIRDFVPIKHGGIKNLINTEPFNDSRAYGLSKQFNGYYSSRLVKLYKKVDRFWWWFLIPVILIGSVVVSIKNRTVKWISRERGYLLLMLCIGHLINIFICGTFSNHLNSRYSMRTLWLVNLAVVLLAIFIIESRKGRSVKDDQVRKEEVV